MAFSPFRYSFTQPETQSPYSYPYRTLFNSGQLNLPQIPEVSQTPKRKSFEDFYKEVSNQEMPAQSAYSDFLKQGYPEPEKINKRTRLAAILAGATTGFVQPGAGSQAAEEVINRPYERAVRRYGMEGQQLKEAANVEESNLTNRTRLAKEWAESGRQDTESARQDKELEIRIEADKRAERLAKNTLANSALTQQQKIAQITHEGIETKIVDGYLYIVNKSDQTVKKIGKIGESPEEGSKRSVDEAIAKEQGTAPIRYGFSSRLQENLFGQQDESQRRLFEQQRGLEATRQAGLDRRKTATTQSETQKELKRVEAFKAVKDIEPDRYEDYWSIASDGKTIILKPPKTGAKEPKAWADYVRLYNALHPDTPMNPNQTSETPEQRLKRLTGG